MNARDVTIVTSPSAPLRSFSLAARKRRRNRCVYPTIASTAAVTSGRARSSRKSVVTNSAPIRWATSLPRSALVSATPIHPTLGWRAAISPRISPIRPAPMIASPIDFDARSGAMEPSARTEAARSGRVRRRIPPRRALLGEGGETLGGFLGSSLRGVLRDESVERFRRYLAPCPLERDGLGLRRRLGRVLQQLIDHARAA